ncbi:protein PLASTID TRANSCRIPTIONALLY ACTIVE 16, chloroplastic-like [Abrus precatorius]|uniref:Protein PLASTID TRANSCRIPTIONALLY ACTIVE 16, chloroplastic-like n=1 Tax=Abrus precatorius TaxID=3816 RepID=A0A8B8KBT9_ABRPR|nr:protein PLASTID TRANSCRIPTIONALLY ACTIVE 16, chloroplastic-like [Abrus precatorius]
MVLTLTSNPRWLSLSNPRLRVFPNKKKSPSFSPLGLGKPKAKRVQPDDNSPNSSNPFRFKLGKKKLPPEGASFVPIVSIPSSPSFSFGKPRRKDPATVFVAGATGQTGIRIAQTLLREGFTVRAGVPQLSSAQQLARLATQYKIISKEESKRLNAVESGFDDAESIAKAIGNASKVVVTISSAENGPTSAVSTSDALQVVQAAQLAGASHVAIIYDDNTAGTSTYNVLDGISSFFSNLFSQSQPLTVQELLQKIIETNVSYTFIKTSLTDDFSPESSYNVVVSSEASTTINDYKVAKFKIASVVAGVFSNTVVAENKVVKVFTNPEAPSRLVDEFLSTIPEDNRRKAYAEMRQKAEEEEARVVAEKTREITRLLEEGEEKPFNAAQKGQEKAEATGASMEGLLNKAKDFGAGLSWQRLSSQIGTSIQKPDSDEKVKPKVQLATVRGQAKARSLQPNKAVIKQKSSRSLAGKPKQAEKAGEVRNVFGGLFKQETIYVDDA